MRAAWFWLVVGIAASVLIGREWAGSGEAPVPPVGARPAQSAPPARSVPAPGMDAGANEASALPVGVRIASSAELVRKFNTAPSLRAFVYEALKKPEEGGYQYAFAALGFCKYDGTTLPVAPTATTRQHEATEALARRCDMSAAERDAARMQITADRKASFDRDPYLALAFDRLTALDGASQHKVISQVLDTQDPLTMQSLDHEVSYIQDGRELRGVYFAGRYYPGGDGNSMFDYALLLAQCSVGLDCGPGSLPLLMMCIQKDWCGESVNEALRNGLGPQQTSLYAQVETLAARLAYEIKRKNAAAFVAGP